MYPREIVLRRISNEDRTDSLRCEVPFWYAHTCFILRCYCTSKGNDSACAASSACFRRLQRQPTISWTHSSWRSLTRLWHPRGTLFSRMLRRLITSEADRRLQHFRATGSQSSRSLQEQACRLLERLAQSTQGVSLCVFVQAVADEPLPLDQKSFLLKACILPYLLPLV